MAIIDVFVRPPKDSWRIRVSFDSLENQLLDLVSWYSGMLECLFVKMSFHKFLVRRILHLQVLLP